MGGRHSRQKGARSERQLRDELIRHGWSDVVRVPLSGAVKTRQAYQDDVVGRPPGWGSEIRFENKARATGFESIYALVPLSVPVLGFSTPDGKIVVLSLDPNKVLDVANRQSVTDISLYTPAQQKVMRQIIKKCEQWIGGAQILSLRQDRMPFLYIRYYR